MAPVELEATLNRALKPCLGCGFPSPLICFTKTLLKARFQNTSGSKECSLKWPTIQDGEHMYTCGGFILIFGKSNTVM